jgi:hypothetical protein
VEEDIMRRKLLVAALCCLALPVAALLVLHRPVAGTDVPATPAQEQLEVEGLDPTVQVLLRKPAENDPDHTSPFFTALLSLARRHKAKPDDYLPHESGGFAVRAGPDLVAVVMASQGYCIPGSVRQHLLLLDRKGRALDRLCCEISSRCIEDERSKFCTEEASGEAADGARLVIRYTPAPGESISEEAGGWVAHHIIHGGKTYSFSWDQSRPGAIKSRAWRDKGLCRVGVIGGKFVVLWPDLGAAER